MRSRLIQARKEKGYTQRQFAAQVSVGQDTVSSWERGESTPDPIHIPRIRDILECQDPHLFDVDSPVGTWTLKDIADMIRRHFIQKLGAAFGLAPLLSNMTIALVTTPTVEPDEYLSLVRMSIPTWWEWLYQGNNHRQLEDVLSKNVPVLARLATTESPFQSQAASLAVQAKIMQKDLATGRMQFGETELCSIKAVELGALSGDRNLLALAQFWHGDTFTFCYNRPQTAIPLLNEALSNVDGNALIATRIYSSFAIAHAQNKDETNVRNSIEMAYSTMPNRPVQPPLYRFGTAELKQKEGKAYLYLAEHLNSRSYAQKAYDLLNNSTNRQARSKGMQTQALIRKADAARLLNEKSVCIDNLTAAYEKASSVLRLSQIDNVLSRMPSDWQHEKPIIKLQREVSHALEVARQ